MLDPNITCEGNCVNDGTYKGNACKYVDRKLTYDTICCKNCGIKSENNTITKNGTQMSRITLPITGTLPTYLRLKKKRFVFKSCNSSFTEEITIFKKNCFIFVISYALIFFKYSV